MLDNRERSHSHPLYFWLYPVHSTNEIHKYSRINGQAPTVKQGVRSSISRLHSKMAINSMFWQLYRTFEIYVRRSQKSPLLCSRCIEGVSLTWEQPELQAKILKPQGLKDKKSQNCVKAAISFLCTTCKRQLLFALLQLITFVCTTAIDNILNTTPVVNFCMPYCNGFMEKQLL